jgi:hypothetical protein
MINLYDNKVRCKSCNKDISLERAIEFNGLCEKCYKDQLFTISVKGNVVGFDVRGGLRSRYSLNKDKHETDK